MNRKLFLIPLGLALPLAGLALAQSAPDGIDVDAIDTKQCGDDLDVAVP